MILIPRKEAEEINRIQKWALLYGRRKTGKTFLVQNFVKFNNFFFVNRDGSIYSEKLGKLSVDTLIALLNTNTGTIVIDEFQRLFADGDDAIAPLLTAFLAWRFCSCSA